MKSNTKLYLKIIGFILILTPFIDLTINNGYKDAIRGFNDGISGQEEKYINIIPKSSETIIDQIPIKNQKIIVEQIELKVASKQPNSLLQIIVQLTLIFLAFLFFLFIILIIRRFIANKLLEKHTYEYIICFSINLFLFSILVKIDEYLTAQEFQKYFQNNDFIIAKVNFIDTETLVFCLFLIAFAIAIKQSISLKEENDLTI